MATAIWFFSEGGQQEGPMGLDDLLHRIRVKVGQQVFVWKEGMAHWLPPDSVPELQPMLPTAPAAAPAAAPAPAVAGAPAEAGDPHASVGTTADPAAPVARHPQPASARGRAYARVGARAGARSAPWFAVSTNKLVIMYVVTLGFYGVYWFYKQWKHVERRTNDKIYPVLGAIFSGISAFLLFPRIQKSAEQSGLKVSWSPGGMAFLILVLSNLWRLPDPLWLVCITAVVPMVSVQKTVNDLLRREAPFADRNDEFSAANWAMILVGGFIMLLAVIGSFLPAEI